MLLGMQRRTIAGSAVCVHWPGMRCGQARREDGRDEIGRAETKGGGARSGVEVGGWRLEMMKMDGSGSGSGGDDG